MGAILTLDDFDEIYHQTYQDILKFVICKYSDFNDVNDIIQDTYFQLYKILTKKNLENNNIKEYIIQIANNKMKKHYTLASKIKSISLFSKNKEGTELIDSFSSDLDIEGLIITESQCKDIWDYLKTKKADVPRIFALHYFMDLTIKEISIELEMTESSVKNCLYRTIKELRGMYGKGEYSNEITRNSKKSDIERI